MSTKGVVSSMQRFEGRLLHRIPSQSFPYHREPVTMPEQSTVDWLMKYVRKYDWITRHDLLQLVAEHGPLYIFNEVCSKLGPDECIVGGATGLPPRLLPPVIEAKDAPRMKRVRKQNTKQSKKYIQTTIDQFFAPASSKKQTKQQIQTTIDQFFSEGQR